MSRKSKKGFKRLENHELSEFTSLQNGDTGSESELLDLTTVDEHESHGRYNSCCCWCSCLYFGLLTLLLLLVGMSVGYLTWSLWQDQAHTDTRFSEAEGKMDDLLALLNDHKTYENRRILSFGQSLRTAHDNMTLFEDAMGRQFRELQECISNLSQRVEGLEGRLAVIESQPKETLGREVEQINIEMRVLNRSLAFLNHSLVDVQAIQVGMASVHSEISRYDAALSEIRNDVSELSSGFDVRVGGVRDSIAEEHTKMAQTTDLLSEQITGLNNTLRADVTQLGSEVTELGSKVDQTQLDVVQLDRAVSMVNDSISTLTEFIQLNPFNKPTTSEASSPPRVTAPPPSTPPPPPPVTTPEVHSVTASITTQAPSEPTTAVTDSTGSKSITSETGVSPSNPMKEGEEEEEEEENNVDATESSVSAALPSSPTPSSADAGGENGTASEEMGQTGSSENDTDHGINGLNDLLDKFSDLDLDQDNYLSAQELQHFIDNPVIFRMLDVNGDHYVSVEEIEIVKANLLQSSTHEDDATPSSSEEGEGGEGGSLPTAPSTTTTTEAPVMDDRAKLSVLNTLLADFSKLDENFDGFLSLAELQDYLPVGSPEILLSLFDENKDTALGRDEITLLRNKIMASMANGNTSEGGEDGEGGEGGEGAQSPKDELYDYLHA